MTHTIMEMDTMRALQKLPQLLEKVAANTDPQRAHFPALAPLRDGNWGTICAACSDKAGRFVQRCELVVDTDKDWPPAVLYPHAIRPEQGPAALTAARSMVMSSDEGSPVYEFAKRIIVLLREDS